MRTSRPEPYPRLRRRTSRSFAAEEPEAVERYLHISSGEAERILDQLVKTGALNVQPGKRTKRYRLAPGASVASVTVSHVSQPAKIRDTSIEGVEGGEEVSQNLDRCDSMTYVTLATLPTGEADSGLVTTEPAVTLAPGVEQPRITPDRIAIDPSRVQELIDGGLSKADAQRQAVEEARAAGPDPLAHVDWEQVRAWLAADDQVPLLLHCAVRQLRVDDVRAASARR